MANKLELVAETDGVLWSVRTSGSVFLVVRVKAYADSPYDVHAVTDGGVEYLGYAPNHQDALALIQARIDGS